MIFARQSIRWWVALKLLLVLVAGFALLACAAYYFAPKPNIKLYTPYSKAYTDKHGTLLRLSLAADDRYRLYQPLESFSPAIIEATILYEDQDYYEHAGVDLSAIIRAAWGTYIERGRRVGASTITMQVARLHWNISSNNLRGKSWQIIRAMQLSRHYTKDQILELYLNLAPYGRNIEGITAASLIYFDKKPSQLNLPEALALAVIPQNPNKRNPTRASNVPALLSARKRLFQRWLETHPEDSVKSSQLDLPFTARAPEQLPFTAPHFINYVSTLGSHWDYGYTATTLDLHQQKRVEQILHNYVNSKRSIGINNASALLLNYKTMSIEAMVGSANFGDQAIHGQVNAATAKRSPGSTLKPLVYGLALDEGLIHPMSLLKDSPRRFGGFTPQNYDKRFMGPVSATNALIESRNVPAVDLQARLKNRSLHELLSEAGVSGLKDRSHYGLALALGGGEVTMLELAKLYAMVANQGELRKIEALAPKQARPPATKQLLSKEASFMVLDMLKDNPSPQQLQLTSNYSKNQVAWKTGTSWAFRDAWAVGVSGPYVLVVWVGNFDGKGNSAFVGRSAAGPLLFSLFRSINANIGWQVEDSFSVEAMNLKKVDVCSETGDLYQKYCRSLTSTWFIPGTSPIKVSNVHRPIPIDKKSGLRACSHRLGATEMKVYEFWPSDFIHIFEQAGISLKAPPRYEAGCNFTDKGESGQPPVITSPQLGVEYAIRREVEADRQIPLKAIVDSTATKLHWFVDESYLGSADTGEALLWSANAGEYLIRAVDDFGRSASKRIAVRQIH